jgi:hypothetical protein
VFLAMGWVPPPPAEVVWARERVTVPMVLFLIGAGAELYLASFGLLFVGFCAVFPSFTCIVISGVLLVTVAAAITAIAFAIIVRLRPNLLRAAGAIVLGLTLGAYALVLGFFSPDFAALAAFLLGFVLPFYLPATIGALLALLRPLPRPVPVGTF